MNRITNPKDKLSSVRAFALCFTVAFAVGTGAPLLSYGQDAIAESTLQALKEATVFVRVDMGRDSGTGSGFLIGKKGKYGYIVTNEHVVRQRGRVKRRVTVDFFSGSKNRKSLNAVVLSEDKSRDLSVLRIDNEKLPDPIALKSSTKIRETLPVYILGYPFGEALSTSGRGPNVTIGKGTISSIRRDDFDAVETVQVDGDINPGNSGGPIVFADGSLMGVSVATVLGTQIGMGIPGESVLDMLFGRIGSLGMSQKSERPKQVTCKLSAELIDPLENLKSISFYYIESKQVSQKDISADEDGRWSRISPRMKEVKLELDGQLATGKTIIRGDYGEKIEILHQVKVINGRGETSFTSPAKYVVNIPARESNSKRDSNGVASSKKESDKDSEDGWLGSDKEVEKKETKETKEAEKEPEGWLGNDNNEESSSTLNISPKKSNVSVGGEKFDCVDAKCQKLNFKSGGTIPNLVWDTNHKHFFMLNDKGLLRKISFPGLVEVASIDFAAKCQWLQMSKEGLCVLVSGLQDLVVLDPDSLKPKKKFAVGTAAHFAAAPSSSLTFLMSNGKLHVKDLRNGKTLRTYIGRDFQSDNGRVYGFDKLTLTPDGNYLFCVGLECLQSFRVRGDQLTFEGSGPRIGSNYRHIIVSDDSKYVALPSGGGNGKGYSTYIYSVKNIKDKVLEVQSGAYPQTIAFDKKAGMIYGQNHGMELITFTRNGLIDKSYDLLKRNSSSAIRMLVHPDGHKVIVMTPSEVIVVNLPE